MARIPKKESVESGYSLVCSIQAEVQAFKLNRNLTKSRFTSGEFETLFWSVGECFFVLMVARSFWSQVSKMDPSFAVLLLLRRPPSKKLKNFDCGGPALFQS